MAATSKLRCPRRQRVTHSILLSLPSAKQLSSNSVSFSCDNASLPRKLAGCLSSDSLSTLLDRAPDLFVT
jgi:hypothetical protein